MSENESKLTFPCSFTFKIFGLANAVFEGEVLKIIRQHFPQLSEGAVSLKPSRNNKYLALSITVQATSQAQLDAVYTQLSHNQHILFVL